MYEVDQIHADLIIDGMGVTKSAFTPGSNEEIAKAAPRSLDRASSEKTNTVVEEHGGRKV